MGCGASDLTESEEAILRLGELVHKADSSAEVTPGSGHAFLHEAATHLSAIEEDERDNYSILVYSRHGRMYFMEHDLARAIEAYQRAINLAEIKIAERCRGLYLMLQRYAECMGDIAKIWIDSANGVGATTGSSAVASRRESHISLHANDTNSVVSGISLTAAAAKKKRRDEATAEIVLLRCIETIEEGHNRRSDLLVDPLMQLSQLYESLQLYARAELLVRRCIGILIVQFGHDHPRLAETNIILDRIVVAKEETNRLHASLKIQSIWKMHRAMENLSKSLHRSVRRHVLETTQSRTPTPPADFLANLVGEEDDNHSSESPMDDRPVPLLGSPHRTASSGSLVRQANGSSSSPTPRSNKGSFHALVPSAGSTSSPRRSNNPLDAALQAKPFRTTQESAERDAEQAAPRVWSVPGAEDDIADTEEDTW